MLVGRRMDNKRLEISVIQLVDDASLKKNRSDGTGWELGWAELKRDWMDATTRHYAYRCLPLSIANQLGFWVRNPVGFTAYWRGEEDNIEFTFDTAGDTWRNFITSHFRNGIITWNTPFIFRTAPVGSRLLVCGPPNYIKPGAQALMALLESDWMVMSFTMNWKILRPWEPVRFEAGEPLFQAIPLARNPCLDLEQAHVVYRKLEDDPALSKAYHDWQAARNDLHQQQRAGTFPGDEWQKHYFRGKRVDGQGAETTHYTKIRPPQIHNEVGRTVVPAPQAERATESAAPVPAGPPVLRSWRLHPRAARLEAPGRTAYGFDLYAPQDLDLIWYGGRSFDWKALSPYADDDAGAVAGALARTGGGADYEPPRKLDLGGPGEGVAALWSGLLCETPPGWVLEVRPPESGGGAPICTVAPTLLPTDRGPCDVTLHLRFQLTDRWVHLRRDGLPLARLVPVRREAVDGGWQLREADFEGSPDAAELFRRWQDGRR